MKKLPEEYKENFRYTEKENKGIYADRSVPDVVDELYKSSNIAHVRVAKLLKEKYL